MKSNISCFFFLCFIVAGLTGNAQTGPVKNAGNVKTAVVNNQQVAITTDNAYAQVTVYAPNVIRIRVV